MADHDHNFLECCKHLTKLLIAGELDDHWRDDPACIKRCCKVILVRCLDWWAPDPDVIMAEGPFTDQEAWSAAELLKVAGAESSTVNEQVSAGGMEFLVPLLIRMLLQWLDERYSTT